MRMKSLDIRQIFRIAFSHIIPFRYHPNALNKIAKPVRILEKNYFYFPNRKMENNKIRLAFPSKRAITSKASSLRVHSRKYIIQPI